jgi:hypothetical protein
MGIALSEAMARWARNPSVHCGKPQRRRVEKECAMEHGRLCPVLIGGSRYARAGIGTLLVAAVVVGAAVWAGFALVGWI